MRSGWAMRSTPSHTRRPFARAARTHGASRSPSPRSRHSGGGLGGDRSLVVRWHFGILGWGVLPPFRRADLLADHLAREGKVVRMVARAGDFFLIVTSGADPWSLRRHYVGLIGKEDAVKLARLLAEAGQEDRTNLSEGRTKKVMKILNNVVGFFGEEAGDD